MNVDNARAMEEISPNPDIENSVPQEKMAAPKTIEFENDWLFILSKTLLTASPEEGCALLIGEHRFPNTSKTAIHWVVKVVWQCRNTWKPGMVNLGESSNAGKDGKKIIPSKRNRFALDPREQITAQRWARKRNLKVLGSAHSHPLGKAIPSATDLEWTTSPQLMVIIGKHGEAKAWWMANDHNFYPIEVTNCQPK